MDASWVLWEANTLVIGEVPFAQSKVPISQDSGAYFGQHLWCALGLRRCEKRKLRGLEGAISIIFGRAKRRISKPGNEEAANWGGLSSRSMRINIRDMAYRRHLVSCSGEGIRSKPDSPERRHRGHRNTCHGGIGVDNANLGRQHAHLRRGQTSKLLEPWPAQAHQQPSRR